MSRDDREAEDVAGLFRKFGGDAKSYKEFEPVPELGQPRPAWTLIPGSPGAPPGSAPNSPRGPWLGGITTVEPFHARSPQNS